MANGYVGISDVARKLIKGYVGVNDVARKLIKGYVGATSLYTPIEYLESTGAQWIDTGVHPDTNIHCIVDFQFPVLPSVNGGVIGGWDSNYGMLFGRNNSYFQFAFGTSAWGGQTVSIDTNRHVLYMNDENGDGRLDDTVLASHTNVSTLKNLTKTLWLFRSNGGASFVSCKIYSCKIYAGETLIRDFVPALDEFDVPCLLDKVENKFYYSKGTGSFNYSYPNTDEYDVLDYIQSNGTQFVNTGIAPQDSTCIEVKFQATAGGQMGYLAGTYQNGASGNRYYVCGTTGAYFTFNLGNDAWRQTVSQNTNVNHFIYNNSNKKFVWNGSEYSYAPSTFGNANTNPMGLLSVYPQESNKFKTKLFFVKIYNRHTNEMLRWFIPVVDKSDNKACLYDMVSKQFFKDVNQNDFTAGNVVGTVRQPQARTGVSTRLCYYDLPYKELNYILSTGSQYINTNYKPSTNTILKFKITLYGNVIDYERIIDAFSGSTTNLKLQRSNTSTTWGYSPGGSGGVNVTLAQNIEYTIEASNHNIIVNGVESTFTAATYTSSYNMQIFHGNDRYGRFALHYFQIWEGSNLIKDYIPVLYNNTPCLYDKVSGTYTYNSGSGTFLYG